MSAHASVEAKYEKKTSEIIIDPKVFTECHSKEIGVWSWKKLKTVKHVIHFKNGVFLVRRLE